MKNKTNWKLFWKLLAACVVTTVMVLPYTLALSPSLVKLFTTAVYVAQIIQSAILFAIAIYLGLKLARATGMEMPVLEGKKPVSHLKSILGISVGMGALSGILIILISFLFATESVTMLKAETGVATWKAFLASFYGGIGEEILLRLFVLNLFAWIYIKITGNKGRLSTAGFWTANIVSAIIFGLGHLGITGSLTAITAMIVVRAIILNGIGGIIFGWLYREKGLESAMIAHFSADIVLHVITPLIALALF